MGIDLITSQFNYPNLSYLFPEEITLLLAFLLFILDLLLKPSSFKRTLFLLVSFIGLLISFIGNFKSFGINKNMFEGTYTIDDLSALAKAFEIGLTLFVLPFVHNYMRAKKSYYYEVYYLIVTALFGMLALSSSYDLIVIYIALEVVSISFYVLTALFRGSFISKEGAFKYLIIGGISITIAFYGAALMYAYGHSLDLRNIMLANNPSNIYYFVVGLVLFLVGFAVKIGLVPFHFWVPDAYEGAPTPITGFMASAGKIAFFIPLFRVLPYINEHFYTPWVYAVSFIAALTMIYGNIVALIQTDIKRLLAYSSIAHSGYILAVLSSNTALGLKAGMYFVFVYGIMGLGSFLVLASLERNEGWDNSIQNFSGLYANNLFMAIAFGTFMFALLGVPPTVGFVGKALVFMGLAFKNLFWLAFVLILATAVSTGYYVRLVVLTFLKDRNKTFEFKNLRAENLLVGLLAVLSIILGVFPMIVWNNISFASEHLFRIVGGK